MDLTVGVQAESRVLTGAMGNLQARPHVHLPRLRSTSSEHDYTCATEIQRQPTVEEWQTADDGVLATTRHRPATAVSAEEDAHPPIRNTRRWR